MSQILPTKGIGARPRVEVRGRDLKKTRFELQNFSLIVQACSIYVMCAVYLGISIDLLAKINLHYNACQFFSGPSYPSSRASLFQFHDVGGCHPCWVVQSWSLFVPFAADHQIITRRPAIWMATKYSWKYIIIVSETSSQQTSGNLKKVKNNYFKLYF